MAVFILDEVHRLTSEGQENCLQFDKGYFTRMGEAEKKNVSIKFIFATTEAVNQHF